MLKPMAVLALTLLMPGAAARAEDGMRLGQDLYISGLDVTVSEAGLDDVFAAGEAVAVRAPLGGTAHLAGREVTVTAPVGNVYAAGQAVVLSASVAGNATLAGYRVTQGGGVAGNLRAAGNQLDVAAPVGGTAALAGHLVRIDAPIAGDVALSADKVEWGPAARIDGRLRLRVGDPEMAEVPARVAPADRVSVTVSADAATAAGSTGAGAGAPAAGAMRAHPGAMGPVLAWIGGVLVVAVLAAALALIWPDWTNRRAGLLRERPWRELGFGVLGQSAMIGLAVILILSLYGILIAPLPVVLAMLAAYLGRLLAAYAVGAGLLRLAGRDMDPWWARLGAALLGAVVTALVAMIPWIGWPAILLLSLAGTGALIAPWIASRFRVEPAA